MIITVNILYSPSTEEMESFDNIMKKRFKEQDLKFLERE